MTIRIIPAEEAAEEGEHEQRVLLEQTPGHAPEFQRFIGKALENAGGALYFRGPSGMAYRMGRTGVEGSGGAEAIEVSVLLHSNQQTIVGGMVDLDLWSLLEWIFEGAGEPWSVEGLRRAGTLYKIPGAPERDGTKPFAPRTGPG